MRRADLTILAGVAVLGLVAAFWFMVLAPKRDEAAKLGDQVTELGASVSEQEQLAAAAEEAESGYDENYHRVVVLGKAVPEDADTPSLLVELQRIADEANVEFQSIELAESSGAAAAAEAAQVATPPPLTAPEESSSASTTPASSESSATTEDSSSTTTDASTTAESTSTTEGAATADASTTATTSSATTVAPATEEAAATLPIGATVGPAGLPVMPYNLSFSGGFFEVADFLADLDALVDASGTTAHVHGRLLTVDAFSLSPVEDAVSTSGADPVLNVSLAVTTYLTPAEQGLVAGATPVAPAPTTPAPATTTPAAETTATATDTTTTATTP